MAGPAALRAKAVSCGAGADTGSQAEGSGRKVDVSVLRLLRGHGDGASLWVIRVNEQGCGPGGRYPDSEPGTVVEADGGRHVGPDP